MPWFRFYNETLGDRKIAYIAQETGQPKGIIMGLWSTILTIASSSPQRGILLFTENKPITIQHLCFETGFDIELVTELLEALLGMELLSIDDMGIYSVTNWGKRQFTSDHSTERVRKHREAKKSNDNEAPVGCSGNVSETDQRQITDTESDSDTELESSPPTAEIAVPPAPKKPPPKKSPLEPDTWQARMMFAKLAANARAKGRRGPKRFGSLEQKTKFTQAVARLDGQFEEALDAGLENSILAVGKLVNYIASPKWQDPEQQPQQKRQQRQKIEEPLDVKLQREEVRRRLGGGDG
jgi:predicted transcriptional regulator